MGKKEVIHPDKADQAFSTGAYSAGVEIDGWLYVGGKGPVDFKTSRFVLGTIEKKLILPCIISNAFAKRQVTLGMTL